MADNLNNVDFDQLVDLVRTGDASHDDIDRLNDALLQTASWRQRYLSLIWLEAELQRCATIGSGGRLSVDSSLLCGSTGPSLEPTNPTATVADGRFEARPKRSHFWEMCQAIAFLVIGVFVGAAITGPLRNASYQRTDAVTAPAPPSARAPVVNLVSTAGCIWGNDSDGAWIENGRLPIGHEVALLEGLAKFHLRDGFLATCEGPAAFVVTSASSIVVQYGKMTFRVDPSAGNASVAIPSGRLTLSDAEIGVRVAGEQIDIHSFSGKTIATLSPFDPRDHFLANVDFLANIDATSGVAERSAEEIEIKAGQGISLVNRDGQLILTHSFDASESEFASRLPLAGPLPITPNYVRLVRAAAPVAYWRFERLVDGAVPNEVAETYALDVVGEVRWTGGSTNRVAEFGTRGVECSLRTSEPIRELDQSENYTVEFWYKPSHLHRGAMVSLIDEPDIVPTRHALLLETTGGFLPTAKNGRLRCVHRSPPRHDLGPDVFSTNPYKIRNWQYVTAIKEGEQLQLYVDGALEASFPEANPIFGDLHVVCGQLGVKERERSFVGHIDELAIYDRALSEGEMLSHWNTVHQGLRQDENMLHSVDGVALKDYPGLRTAATANTF